MWCLSVWVCVCACAVRVWVWVVLNAREDIRSVFMSVFVWVCCAFMGLGYLCGCVCVCGVYVMIFTPIAHNV